MLYLYVFYLNGLVKLQEGVFKHANLTFYNQSGNVIHLYLTTYNNPYFWRCGAYRMQVITNLAQECRAVVGVKEGWGEKD